MTNVQNNSNDQLLQARRPPLLPQNTDTKHKHQANTSTSNLLYVQHPQHESIITMSDNTVVQPLVYRPPQKEDFPPSSSWRRALLDVLSSVETDDNNPIFLFKNDKYVCTYDKYPKAKYHLLLMCRRRRQTRDNEDTTANGTLKDVQTLNDLTANHLEELRE